MSNEPNGFFEFGSYRLDAAKRLLTRSGESIALAPKTFDLLLLLIRGQGRVLTKTKLMNALWPDTVVEEASLSYQVATLRKALGAEEDGWIETVPKHGYRFAGAIAKFPDDHEQSGDDLTIVSAKRFSESPGAQLQRQLLLWVTAALGVLALALGGLAFLYSRQTPPAAPVFRFSIALPEDTRVLESFAISPDGRLLAMSAQVNGKFQLWVRALEALQARVMPGTDDARYPFWSPDSRYIGFFAGGKLKKVAASGPGAVAGRRAERTRRIVESR